MSSGLRCKQNIQMTCNARALIKFSGKSTRGNCTPELGYQIITPIATYQLFFKNILSSFNDFAKFLQYAKMGPKRFIPLIHAILCKPGDLTLYFLRVPKIKMQEKSQISFCKILKNKCHVKVLLKTSNTT